MYMISPTEEGLLLQVLDVLLELYELRRHAKDRGEWERVSALETEIARAEAQRSLIREWENRHSQGQESMTKVTNRQQRHVREKSIIDHVARELFEPKQADKRREADLSPTTSTGLPVEEQVRKEWDPRKGGLPTF